MKATTTALAAAFVFLALTATGSARILPLTDTARDAHSAAKAARAVSLSRATIEVAEARGDVWRCQDRLDIARTRPSVAATLLPRSVAYRKWVAKKWVARGNTCERQLARRTLPATHDWLTAVRVVQRIYPGTADWLIYISDREGGHGPWVWYGGRRWEGHHIGNDYLGSDTVGGWMQFRYSTFEPYWPQAKADAERRGFIIPDLGTGYGPWLEPLGQALTAGYMKFTGREGCHWCLG